MNDARESQQDQQQQDTVIDPAADTQGIRTAQGWPYLAVVLDLYSRRVVGAHHAGWTGHVGSDRGAAAAPASAGTRPAFGQ
jgi:transposase InsO family protein